MSDSQLTKAQVEQLSEFVRLCKQDPELLHHPDLSFFRSYVESLGGTIPAAKARVPEPSQPSPQPSAPAATEESDESDLELDNSGVIEPDTDAEQPMGDADKEVGEEEVEKSNDIKRDATSAFAEGDFQKAIQLYTEAIILNPQSALVYAKRGQCYLQLQKPNACIRDCNRALEINPDSATAFKFRGRAHRVLGHWEEAAQDLRNACKIDFDEQADEYLREVTPNARKLEEHRRKHERRHAEKELQEKMERARRAKEEHARAASQNQQEQQPGEGSGDMGDFYKKMMNDPEIMQAFIDPEVSAAFQDVVANPANLAKYQNNPKVKAVITKLMSKFGGSMPAGGFPGMPGGFPGMPGGFPGSFPPPPTGGAGANPREDDVGLD